MIRSGYSVAESVLPPFQTTTANPIPRSSPYPCSPPNPENKLLINSNSNIPALEDTATIKAGNLIENNFQKLHETLSGLSSQITSLAETQSRSEEQMLRMQKLCHENASQIKLLAESQMHIQQQLQQQLGEHHDAQMQLLKDAQAANTKELQRTLVSNIEAVNDLSSRVDDWHAFQAQAEGKAEKGGQGVGCTHNVHPPPRKIDRPIVGYDYGTGIGVGRGRVDRAKGLIRC